MTRWTRPPPRHANAREYHKAFEEGQKHSPYTYSHLGKDDCGRDLYGIGFDGVNMHVRARLTWREYKAAIDATREYVGICTLTRPCFSDCREEFVDGEGQTWRIGS